MVEFNLLSKIELITSDNEKTLGLIQDVIDGNIYISVHSDDRQFKILRIGDKITGLVYDNDSVISFEATVSSRLVGDFPTYVVSSIKNLTKVQRRQDIRVECNIELLFTNNKYLSKLDLDKENTIDIIQSNERYFNNGWMLDLSAGGLRFSCEKKYNLGEELLLVFNLDRDTIIVIGQIVFKGAKITKDKTLFIYGMQFLDITEDKKEKIIGYNFVIMRKIGLRKRG